jgi:hypothetical protein
MGQRLLGRRWMPPALAALGLVLLLAACNTNADKSDDHRHDGLYGGVSGGITRLP